MNPNSKEFKALQRDWYKKLKKEGFVDKERKDGLLLEYESFYVQSRYTKDSYLIKEEYYRKATHFLNDYQFSSQKSRYIWWQHSEGVSTRDISEKLKKLGITMARNTVSSRIIQLRAKMKEFYSHE